MGITRRQIGWAGSFFATAGLACAQEVAEPELPLPDWQEVPETTLFPAVPRGGEAGGGVDGGGTGVGDGFFSDGSARGVASSGGSAGVLGMGELLEPGELERYIESLPELEDVGALPEEVVEQARVEQAGRLTWWDNPRAARKHATAEGKYFLLAFVGLEWQTLSNSLNEEVFNSPAFANFAKDRLVVSYLDYESRPDQNHPVYERFKEVCGVKGFPAVALFAPDGVHLETYNGYNRKMGAVGYLRRLAERVEGDESRMRRNAKRRAELEASGYRVWHNTQGKGTFARLRGLRDERVYFEHDDGRRTAAPLGALSFVDREVARRLWERERKVWETPFGSGERRP